MKGQKRRLQLPKVCALFQNKRKDKFPNVTRPHFKHPNSYKIVVSHIRCMTKIRTT